MFKVAIIGKPNVGKSTLFNRLVGKRQAIVLDRPGTTRDRNYAICTWLGKEFELIDTGGFTLNKVNSDQEFQYLINLQISFAIAEADLLLYVVSEKEGISDDDLQIARKLKKSNKNIVLLVNKAENSINNNLYQINWKKLGLNDPVYVSAEHGLNIFKIFDAIFKFLPENEPVEAIQKITFCVLGKPNVGKSSLINGFLEQEKMIVSNISGTTRDAIDNDFKYDNQFYTIIDTAGIRKRGKLDEIEKFALLRSEMAIKRSQFVLLMVDASQEISDQDKNVAQLIYDANMPCLIIANKIDLIDSWNGKIKNELTKKIKDAFRFLPYAEIVFTSCKQDKFQVNQIINRIQLINDQLKRQIPQRYLKELIDKAQIINPTPQFKGGKAVLKNIEQVNGRMPTFVITVNSVKYLHFSYMRFIENQIKEAFNFNLTPILVYYKDAKSQERTK